VVDDDDSVSEAEEEEEDGGAQREYVVVSGGESDADDDVPLGIAALEQIAAKRKVRLSCRRLHTLSPYSWLHL